VGIIGLPNAGKSTLFKALTKKQVDIANYPFTTINPNVGVVQVPDERLEKLVEIFKPEKITPATIEFIDIAGLVKDAHQGKGLGNKFLGRIRETNILVEVVRVFEDKNVSHIEGSIDPQRDIKIVQTELKEANIAKPIVYVFNDTIENIENIENIDKLIEICYKSLGLITFYTIKGGKEMRATKIEEGKGILSAAEKIHTDFKEKFIKAEVIAYHNLIEAGSWQAARKKGFIRTEGKDYIVRDNDVIEFKI
jgi:small GTP-binding protein